MCANHSTTMFESVEPFKLQITSMSYLYEVFEHLQLLCIDILMPIHSVTTTDVSPDLGELAESLGDVTVQTIPLWFRMGWGCRTFQTAHHIHVIPIWGLWAPSTVVYRHIAAHSLRYHHRCFHRFGRVSRKSRWCKCANHTTSQCLRLYNLSNCTSHPCHTYMRCLSTFNCCV
jgi:hypothetical protein